MGSQLHAFPRATVFPKQTHPFATHPQLAGNWVVPGPKKWRVIRVSADTGDSYLDMWKKAVERDRKAAEFRKIAENSAGNVEEEEEEVVERKSVEFQKILEVSSEERDRVQRMQVIDRAAAAIAAARALVKESKDKGGASSSSSSSSPANLGPEDFTETGTHSFGVGGAENKGKLIPLSENNETSTPGPNFWSWTPPEDDDRIFDQELARKASPSAYQANPVMELERNIDILSIPFESELENNHSPPLPPLQPLLEVEKAEISISNLEAPHLEDERERGVIFSANAAEAANALNKVDDLASEGIYPDGSRWWKETGTEVRPDGVVCRWTLTRGVSSDKAVEWEEKYWEAADDFDYKELGSEKSGRDSSGNVWREFWKESMYQKDGCVHLEKTADKWGKNGGGNEWQEKWRESYGAGQAEKWAHKWCTIDPNTPLEAGHAHVWHERWGEQYDGQGGSIKYADKWAERCEGDGWAKWGDKWDEHFDPNGHGVKQGETWWEGKYGERWNRTWGEHHNGSGWVHKYGKSSSGEHWDTHEQQETWYERYPHYGFYHCFENSVPLREVKKPSDQSNEKEF